MKNYYIAFTKSCQEKKTKNDILAYGYSPNPTESTVCGIFPIGCEETFETFEEYQARLEDLGYLATKDPKIELDKIEKVEVDAEIETKTILQESFDPENMVAS